MIDTKIDIESQKSNVSHDLSDRINATSESQVSINSNEEDSTRTNTSKKDCYVQINSKISDKDISRNSSVTENSKLSHNNTRTWEEEDPLEGPSWLFNNTMPSRDNEPEEVDVNVSDVNNNTSQVIVYDESSVTESNTEEMSNLNESMSDMQTSEKDAVPIAERSECESYLRDTDGNTCKTLPAATASNGEKNLDNLEDSNADDTMKFTSFVTLRRGHSEAPDEETNDFTLMLRQSTQNMQFNINELRLPVLEESVINNSVVRNEIDTEITAAIPRVTNIPVASVSNRSLNESDYNHITIKLPLIVINDHKRTSTSPKTKHSNKKPRLSSMKSRTESSLTIKNTSKPKNKSENSRDPSAAKVVLEKLNESHVKPKVSSGRSTSDIQSAVMYV